MKKINLTQGEFALVNDEDFDFLNKWKWHCNRERKNKYALRRLPKSEGGKLIKMHRLILGLNNSKSLCDHIDRNGLNNQRNNLRIATATENLRNIGKYENRTSKYKGVYRRIAKSVVKGKKYEYTYWCSSISFNKKEIILGNFKYNEEGEVLAAKAYDDAAKKYFKEFSLTNF